MLEKIIIRTFNKFEMEIEPLLVPIICQISICMKTRSKSV
jgi:hypothetical protein